MKYRFPVTLTRDADGGFTVTFPDFPEGITQGETEEECIAEARDCLDEVLASRVNAQEPIPQPSRIGKFAVEPSAQLAAKVALYEAFQESGFNRSTLARKLAIAETEVRRMLDPHHPTKLPRIEGALSALGKKLRIEVVNAWSEAEIVLAIEMGCEAVDIGLAIHPHPTLIESIGMAAEVYEGTITDLYIPKKK